MEAVSDFTFLESIISADGEYKHEIKRRLVLGRKAYQDFLNLVLPDELDSNILNFQPPDLRLRDWSNAVGRLQARKGCPNLPQSNESLRICSFNVRSFGEEKRTKPEITDVIVQIISRCDIMLLMEIKDSNNRICPFLLETLNRQSEGKYNYVVSNRLGRKNYKEQYAFFYRLKRVSVKETYQYPDLQPGDEDVFSREPFVVWFYSPVTVVREFVVIPVHTMPKRAVREIDELYDVFLDVKQHWKAAENFILMGDFNAGCDYVAKKHWKNIRLRNHTDFVWIIDDESDTTVKSTTRCPYDRVVLHGNKLINATVSGSADIFDFQSAFSMTETQALAVSDHFPVEFQLRNTRYSSRRRARRCRGFVSYIQ